MTNPALNAKKPFAFQAAVAAVGAPIIAIVLSVAIESVLGQAPRSLAVSIIVALVLLTFLVIGFICSIFALFGIRRHGRKGLLGRGITGLALNGFFLLASAFVVLWNPLDSLYTKYAGVWTVEAPPGAIQQLELGADKHFHLTIAGTKIASITGEWHLQPDRNSSKLFLILKAQHVIDGNPDAEGQEIIM